VRYRSGDEDSARWDGFAFRAGDIVISTRSKHGTTWAQMICALLVFQDPALPAPLPVLSPWFDWLLLPRAEVVAQLEGQTHRRFIKTHTPLDGLPLDPRATYVVVARHPLDAAVSLFQQGANLDRDRIAELLGQPAPAPRVARPIREALLDWIARDTAPAEALDSLAGVLWHIGDAWRRRAEPNVVLLHYADLIADLGGEMRQLARRLDIEMPEARWPALIEAAGFAQMRARAAALAPDPAGVLKDRAAFFRRGRSGAGRELLTDDELAQYERRAAALAAPDVLAWLHR
jgi:hypothetical protein